MHWFIILSAGRLLRRVWDFEFKPFSIESNSEAWLLRLVLAGSVGMPQRMTRELPLGTIRFCPHEWLALAVTDLYQVPLHEAHALLEQ